MNSRMDKYAETPNLKSRTEKNKNLYEEIKNADIDKFELNNNATILGEDINKIDVDKIRDMLDKRYRDSIPKRSNRFDNEIEDEEDEKKFDTKEYDINTILEKAKKNQDVDYDRERLKKVHDTQYDILKNLNLDDEKVEIEETEENIMNLINTITALELKNKESSGNTTALDLLSDLKENDTESIYKTMQLDKDNITSFEKEGLDEEDLSIEEKYDDFKELERDLNSNNIAIKVVLIVFLIIMLVLVFIFVNNYFKLGLF
ncbi:MAG: hypothetical protein IJD92_04400 [Bacilli bacterium]|nr:hypothetical protein [Bacilli bacterium]